MIDVGEPFVSDLPPDIDQETIDDYEREKQTEEINRLMSTYGVSPPMTSSEFAAADFRIDYIVDDILPEKQMTVIAGAAKGLKTTTSIDLALSIGAASDFGIKKQFLGRFWVQHQKRVLVCSAESGHATLQETANRIARSKNFELASLGDSVAWEFWVPSAKNSEQLQILSHFIQKHKPDVVIIDPLYQCLDGDDQANVSKNGQQIMDLAKVCLDKDCTPVMVDHVKRSSENAKNFSPLELHDVTGAGKAEAFRSWLLLGRRERFDPENPIHRLWLTVGGSAGHCGSYAVDIDESRDDAGKRGYELNVMYGSEAAVESEERAEHAKAQKAAKKLDDRAQKLRDAFVGIGRNGQTKSKAFRRAGLSNAAGDEALGKLLRDGILEDCETVTPRGKYDGYRLSTRGEQEVSNDE
ncbi:AAA family ATPase [Stieleria sp. JC731]|uniref:AAA family ATPase n=1 Tax=Pirellulaceae TaxID=2691357 RepID=UPI001E28D626|nr:AAA family ATPase [Stieleria sp. JC731]MCC9600771.1 AAA family ATPase [Stieleria sp. JC731]